MVDTNVNLCGINLHNPIIAASGTFGFGYEFCDYYDINVLGGISFKGTTKEPRFGNPNPRIAESYSGMINSIGLQNPGIKKVIEEEIPKLQKCFNKVIIANIGGFTIEEFRYCCENINTVDAVNIVELNVSCPNLHAGGKNFGTTASEVAKVVREVRKVVKKPLFIKLTPNVTDIVEIAKVCESEGADGISLINTVMGMRIDLKTRKPVLANKMGGFSGRAILPIALRAVYQVYEAVKIPLIGIGGIASSRDVIEMMLAGATAVQVGAENLANPFACKEIIEGLPIVMEELKIGKLSDIIGGAH